MGRITRRVVTIIAATLAIVVAIGLNAGLSLADTGTPRSSDEVSRITRQVSQEVYSPYCPGQTLAMCPSSNASSDRLDIQEMARQGMSADEIKEVLLDRSHYGEGYALVEPSREEQVPLMVAILIGLIVAVIVVRWLARRRDDGEKRDGAIADGDGADGDVDGDDPFLDELRAEYRD